MTLRFLVRGIAYASLLATGVDTRYMLLHCQDIAPILEGK